MLFGALAATAQADATVTDTLAAGTDADSAVAARRQVDATFAFARAKLLADDGKLEDAEEAFEEALRLDPSDPFILVEVAKFRLFLAQISRERSVQMSELGEATDLANRAFSLAPDDSDVLRIYADVHLRMAETDPTAIEKARLAYVELAQEDDLQALTSLAQIYLWQRDFDAAVDALIHAADVAPRNRMITSMLVESLLGAERKAEAEEALALLVEIAPDQVESRIRLAELRSERGDHAGAVEVLEAAPEDFLNRFRLQQILSRELHLAGRHQDALALSDALLEDDPRSPGFFRLRMSIFNSLARYEDAAALLEPRLPGADEPERRAQDVMLLARLDERLGRTEKAVALLRTEIESASGEVALQLRLALAGVLQRDGEPAAGAALLEPLLESATGEQLALLAQSLAELWAEAGRLDDGVRALAASADRLGAAGQSELARGLRMRAALELVSAEEWADLLAMTERLAERFADDASDEVRWALSQLRSDALAGLGRADEAIDLLAGDDTPQVRAKRLQVMLEHGRAEDAFGELDAMATSGAADDLLFVARILQSEDHHDRALPVLRRLAEDQPDSIGVLFMLGAALERSGRHAEAVEAFQRLLGRQPDHVPTLNYLGYLWAERGENLEQAAELILRAVSADPDNGAYVDSLGWVYFQLGRLEEARQHLEWASRLEREDPTVFDHLGDLYSALELHEKARGAYRRALELDGRETTGQDLGAERRAEVERKLERLERSGP